MRRLIRLAAACILAAGIVSVPVSFRKPPTTLASIRWITANCEGLAIGGTVLDPSHSTIDSLASTVGLTALPGPAWRQAGRAGTADLFPLRAFAVLFPADSSVLAAVTAPTGLDPGPGPAAGRIVETTRLGARTVELVIARRPGGSLAADAANLLVVR
jgi:hypothetical protein